MDYKTFKEAIEQYFYNRDKDSGTKPDIIIIATPTQFLVKLDSKIRTVYTGFGGLKMFCESMESLDLLKVEFNGTILTIDQKKLLYSKIINNDSNQQFRPPKESSSG